jgi:putative tricarboxylic transport membrane protein
MTKGLSPERRPQRAAFIIAAGLATLAGLLLWDAAGLRQDGGYAGVGPADVPRIIAFGLLLLAALTVIAGLRGSLPSPPRQDPKPILWILGGLGLQLTLLHLIGFALSGALLFGFTARAFGRKPLWLTIIVGFFISVLIYGIFDRLLRLNLPGGPLEMLIFGG